MINTDTTVNGVSIDGVAGNQAAAALRQTVEANAPGAQIDWHVATFDGPYCRAIDLLHPITAGARQAGFALSLDKSRLVKDELIVPHVTLPDWAVASAGGLPEPRRLDLSSLARASPTPTAPIPRSRVRRSASRGRDSRDGMSTSRSART